VIAANQETSHESDCLPTSTVWTMKYEKSRLTLIVPFYIVLVTISKENSSGQKHLVIV
jgi:hypothetical protein